MRIQHRYLTFEKNDLLVKALNGLYVKHKIIDKHFSSDVSLYSLEFSLFQDNPRFSEIQAALAPFNLNSEAFTVYEVEDYQKAEWFIISTGAFQYPQPEDKYKEVIFDLTKYCLNCGTEKLQIAPYRLKSNPKQFNSQFWGLYWEYDALFVREEAKKILEKENITGIKFLQPVFHKNEKGVDG